jgi:hypothetical protein
VQALVFSPRIKEVIAETFVVNQIYLPLFSDTIVFAENNVNVSTDALIALQVGDIVVSLSVLTDIFAQQHSVSDFISNITAKSDMTTRSLIITDIFAQNKVIASIQAKPKVVEEIAASIVIIEQK